MILRDNHEKWILLRKNDRLKLNIMMAAPWLYNRLYGVYARTLQKKQYE